MNATDMVNMMLSSMSDPPGEEAIAMYLEMAKEEILNWTYGKDTVLTEVPSWLVPIQTMAVVVGVNGNGTEGDTSDTIDSVAHTFKYAEMLEYIHENCPVYVKVG